MKNKKTGDIHVVGAILPNGRVRFITDEPHPFYSGSHSAKFAFTGNHKQLIDEVLEHTTHIRSEPEFKAGIYKLVPVDVRTCEQWRKLTDARAKRRANTKKKGK